jgi:hypothetical protein
MSATAAAPRQLEYSQQHTVLLLLLLLLLIATL